MQHFGGVECSISRTVLLQFMLVLVVVATAPPGQSKQVERTRMLQEMIREEHMRDLKIKHAEQQFNSKQRHLITKSKVNPGNSVKGVTLKVLTVHDPPYVDCGDLSCVQNDDCAVKCSGLSIDVLKEVAKLPVVEPHTLSLMPINAA